MSKRKGLALVLVALFFASLVTELSAVPVHAALSWNVQTVDEYAWAGGNCPIVVDSNNITHIAYMGFPNGTNLLTYASYNGSEWTYQTVDSGYVHVVFSLVLDANGHPSILYNPNPLGSPINPLIYARWTGTNWNIQNTGITYAIDATLALDASGNPKIAYTTGVYFNGGNWVGNGLNYAQWTGTNWNIQTVDTTMTDSFSTVSFAWKNDEPYILYSLSSNSSNIKLATHQSNSWNIQSVALPLSTSNCGNVVVDSKGYPHFICTQPYQNTTFSTILYASWDGNAWSTQTVTSKVDLGSIGSLVLDSQNHPHFTYSTSAGETMYVTYSGSAWNIQTLGSNIGAGNLALDANGNPHLSYRIASPARYTAILMYATAAETRQSPYPAVPYSTITGFSAVVIIASIAVVAYVWKKKTQRRKAGRISSG